MSRQKRIIAKRYRGMFLTKMFLDIKNIMSISIDMNPIINGGYIHELKEISAWAINEIKISTYKKDSSFVKEPNNSFIIKELQVINNNYFLLFDRNYYGGEYKTFVSQQLFYECLHKLSSLKKFLTLLIME